MKLSQKGNVHNSRISPVNLPDRAAPPLSAALTSGSDRPLRSALSACIAHALQRARTPRPLAASPRRASPPRGAALRAHTRAARALACCACDMPPATCHLRRAAAPRMTRDTRARRALMHVHTDTLGHVFTLMDSPLGSTPHWGGMDTTRHAARQRPATRRLTSRHTTESRHRGDTLTAGHIPNHTKPTTQVPFQPGRARPSEFGRATVAPSRALA